MTDRKPTPDAAGSLTPALYVVATPLGNLGDITQRALATLRGADWVACEDTRHSRKLLDHCGVRAPMLALHEHNEETRTGELVSEVASGRSVVLITDAGMPGISDPGFRLIRACRERGLPMEVLPGPSAVLTALVGSGLPTHAFYFGGFLPIKSGRRRAELERALRRSETNIYFESPHRLLKTLAVLGEIAPEADVCVARELTKKFEEYRRGRPGCGGSAFSRCSTSGMSRPAIAPPVPRAYASRKGAQDAHEAIRPTAVARHPDAIRHYLKDDQYKVYKLIWQRFVASQMEAAVYDTLTVEVTAKGEQHIYLLRASGSALRFPGFLVVYEESKDEDSVR